MYYDYYSCIDFIQNIAERAQYVVDSKNIGRIMEGIYPISFMCFPKSILGDSSLITALALLIIMWKYQITDYYHTCDIYTNYGEIYEHFLDLFMIFSKLYPNKVFMFPEKPCVCIDDLLHDSINDFTVNKVQRSYKSLDIGSDVEENDSSIEYWVDASMACNLMSLCQYLQYPISIMYTFLLKIDDQDEICIDDLNKRLKPTSYEVKVIHTFSEYLVDEKYAHQNGNHLIFNKTIDYLLKRFMIWNKFYFHSSPKGKYMYPSFH
ncbi:hypothetical protein RF11_07298 [Thelohanellus kitauei]|uniref:Uncharacterized protein n=1 Tax=Thelohanellus kitauei TaxID=669202 RepID=A0A0C2MR44_THEKT|nr:hypothetical protein RF11_07298 [Thelohanellus kitauei]